jgi:prepilin-type N-terminal cleavage/methylation domain-containing protein
MSDVVGDGLRDERGFTLIELLIAASLMIVVLSATLSLLDGLWSNSKRNVEQNDQIELVRTTSDQLIRQARNLANPNPSACGTPPAGYTVCPTIDTATASSIIFQTTDPAKQWVRYCLSNANEGGIASTNANGTIWYQQASSAVAAITATMRTGCPSTDTGASSWATTRVVGRNISNSAQSGRSLFTYDQPCCAAPYLTALRRVKMSFYVDSDTTKSPDEVQVASEVFLRNQNQPPTANFDLLTGAGPTTFTLDGSASTDPEGRNLNYDWYRTVSNPAPSQLPSDANSLADCRANPDATTTVGGLVWSCIGNGVVLSHNFATQGTPNVWLRVVDPGGLPDLSNLPSSGVCPNRTDGTRTDNQCETFS